MKYRVTNGLTRNVYLPGGLLLPGSSRTVELNSIAHAMCEGNGLTVETLEPPKSKPNGKKKSGGKKKSHTPKK